MTSTASSVVHCPSLQLRTAPALVPQCCLFIDVCPCSRNIQQPHAHNSMTCHWPESRLTCLAHPLGVRELAPSMAGEAWSYPWLSLHQSTSTQ